MIECDVRICTGCRMCEVVCSSHHFGAVSPALTRIKVAKLEEIGLDLAVVATPGHTGDSLSFLLAAENVLLTGDTVLGRGTAVVAWPDGELAAYLRSLERIEAMTGAGEVTQILPGHGPAVADAAGVVRYYLEHRADRLEQVRAAVALRGADVDGVLELVYADVPAGLWPVARLSLQAQLDYLRTHP